MDRRLAAAALLSLSAAMAGCAADPSSQVLTMDELARLAAEEEGLLLTYGMADSYGGYRELYDLFEERYGIGHLDIDMSSSHAIARLDEEKHDPVVDAVVAGYLYGDRAADLDLIDCVPSPAASALPAWASGPDGESCRGWFASFYGTLGFMVNTEVVADPPRTWEDLLRDDLAGKVSFIDPRAAATGVGTLLAASLARGGDAEHPQPGVDLLVEIARRGDLQNIYPRQDYAAFVRGTRPIQINYDYNLLQLQRKHGIEATFVYPEDGTVGQPYSTFLVKDRPHPYTGRLFVEFMLGAEGQQAMTRGHVTPILPGVPRSPEMAGLLPPGGDPAIPVDWRTVGQAVEGMQAAFDAAIRPLEQSAP